MELVAPLALAVRLEAVGVPVAVAPPEIRMPALAVTQTRQLVGRRVAVAQAAKLARVALALRLALAGSPAQVQVAWRGVAWRPQMVAFSARVAGRMARAVL